MVAAGWLEWWTAERVVALATTGQLLVLVAAALYARAQVQEARSFARTRRGRTWWWTSSRIGRPS
jgi:transcriptional regulator of nitric oxide reductase